MLTLTGLSAQLQTSDPPPKSETAGFNPPSTEGCIEIVLVM